MFRACCPYGGWGRGVETPHMHTLIDPFQELAGPDVVRPHPIERGDRTAEHVVVPAKGTARLHRGVSIAKKNSLLN